MEGGSEAAVGCGSRLITCISELTATRGWGETTKQRRSGAPTNIKQVDIRAVYIGKYCVLVS